MENNNILYNLIFGLVELTENRRNSEAFDQIYPYPSQLQFSLNHLALYMRESFPHTLSGFLKLMETPLKDWWPQALELPQEIPAEASLMVIGELSEIATEYYYEWLDNTDFTASTSLKDSSLAYDNFLFRKIFLHLRHIYLDSEDQRKKASQDYVMLREFLIRYPYAATSDFRQKLRELSLVQSKDVGELYQPVSLVGPYWNCLNCGPLTVQAGKLIGVKSSVCNSHYIGAPNIVEVTSSLFNQELKVLRRGIHIRTHIPGIVELQLYDWLKEQKGKFANLEVALWPGIDRYDLRLEFGDGETWAVDVKDYKDPYLLARKIETLYGEESLAYDKGFYVFPEYRLEQNSNYREIVEREIKLRGVAVPVVSDESFKVLVSLKLKSLKKRVRSKV